MSKNNSQNQSTRTRMNTYKLRPQDRPMLSSLYRRMNSGLTSRADSVALSTIFKRFSEADLLDLAQKDSMGRKLDCQGADFLVPDRRRINRDLLEAKMSCDPNSSLRDMLPTNAYEERLNHVLFNGELRTTSVLKYGKPTQKPLNYNYLSREILGNIGSGYPSNEVKETIQRDPTDMFKCMITDDFYLNLLDFSKLHNLALGVENQIYIWNDHSRKTISKFTTSITGRGEYVSSVSWSPSGSSLAVGTSESTIEIRDIERSATVRNMHVRMDRIGSLAWNGHLLTCGTRSGFIYNNDIRVPDHQVHSMRRHEMEVCGLKWSTDGTRLSSGGNDDIVCVWDSNCPQRPTNIFKHDAAIKALDWSPNNNSILATGGGSGDKKIRIFNVSRGVELYKRDTGSQISSVWFSKNDNELYSSHGYDQNGISAWSLPSLEHSFTVPAHSERILSMTMTPDGNSLATVSAGNCLKVWKCIKHYKPGITWFVDPIDILHSYIR